MILFEFSHFEPTPELRHKIDIVLQKLSIKSKFIQQLN
jgi:hypothetical protein